MKNDINTDNSICSSPFAHNPANPSVFWISGDDPYDNTLRALSNIDLSPAQGKRVLLKPNSGRDVPPYTGATTHPQVVAAAIDAFRNAGAEVAVGESPITGVKALEAFESTGIAEIAKQRNCPLIDMDVQPFVPVEVPDGIAIKSLKLCREVTEFDIVVSIPVMKTHMHTGVTLAVKNMKGCLWRRSKVDLHMLPEIEGIDEKPLNIAIADMTSVLRPHLSIIDGTIGMEGLGPGGGTPKPFGVVVVGVDAFAADSIACQLMGLSADEIPYLRMAADRGYGIIDLDRINVFPENYKDAVNPFAPSPNTLTLEFPGFTILDKQSCSACQSTLLMFLKQHGQQLLDERKDDKNIVIAIGKGHIDLPEDTICVGNCTAKHKKGRKFVPGCPPVSSEILNEYFR